METVTTLLRQTRDSKKIPLKVAERMTGIPLRYLQVLEGHGESRLFTDKVYLIPYLRTYAHFLDLNPAPLVSQFVAEVEDTPVHTPVTEQFRSEQRFPFSHFTSWGVPLVLLVVLFFMAPRQPQHGRPLADQREVAAARWLDGKRESPAAQPSTDQAQALEAQPPQKEAKVEAAETQPPQESVAAPAQEQTIPPPQDQGAVTALQPPALQGPFALRLTATVREVWVQASIDGGPVQRVRLQQGQTVTWTAKRRYMVGVDDAGGLRASLNGQALPRLGASGRARLNIPIP